MREPGGSSGTIAHGLPLPTNALVAGTTTPPGGCALRHRDFIGFWTKDA